MPLLDPNDSRPVHFIGIAGAGMSALAELLVQRGVTVTGTDANPTGAPDLQRLGIDVKESDPEAVARAGTVVFSSAIPYDHPEMAVAREHGIRLIRRAEALAESIAGGTVIGIAGTHGKTTTTVMTTEALSSAGLDPTGVAGGRVSNWQGNLRLGGDTVVVEADEYDRSFLALESTVAVVLNVEVDHLDIYRDLDDIHRAFEQFLTPALSVVRCADDEGAMALRVRSSANLIEYSATLPGAPTTDAQREARLLARNVVLDASGSQFNVIFDDDDLGQLHLKVPGLHNVRNALAALGSGLALDVSFAQMAPGLSTFSGVDRRFQRLGTAQGVTVIDDYAHHPTEIDATIAAARAAFPDQRLIVVFQPHLYSRTKDLQVDFAEALSKADVVFLCDIYGAREQPEPGVTSALIGDRIGPRLLRWRGTRDEAAAAVQVAVREGDVVVTMGAGDITRTGPELLQRLRA